MSKPKIGIIPGDPGGIGPELIAKLLADRQTQQKADILLIGDGHLFAQGMDQAGVSFELCSCKPLQGVSYLLVLRQCLRTLQAHP